MNTKPTMRLDSIRFLLAACVTAVMFADTSPAQSPAGSGIEVHDCLVRFAEEIAVPALETGRVAEVNIMPNDMIGKGDPIARLDDRSLLIRHRAAQLRSDAAKSDALDDVEIRYAELALAEAEAELEISRSIQNDVRGAVPLSQVRKLRLAVERGELEVAQAKKRRERAKVESELRDADLSVINDQLGNLHIESPIEGVVLELSRAAGEWIEKGEAIATIGRIDRLHVHALLSSDKISAAACRGLPVSVHWRDPTSNVEQTLRGKVLSVDPQMLPGGVFRLHAEIRNRLGDPTSRLPPDGSQWLLKPGVEVRMKVFPRVAASTAAPARR